MREGPKNAKKTINDKKIIDIKANEKKIKNNVNKSLMLVTALTPHIGYDKAAEVSKKAFKENISLREAIIILNYMSGEDFDKLVNPENMISPSKKI